jgi:hypothetical protein
MKEPSGRRWLIGAVALSLVLLVVWIAAAVRISAAAAAPSSLMSSLRSRLTANYAPDPGGSSVRSLRLSIFQEVMQDLGMPSDEAAAHSQEMQAEMQEPVPTATARDFEGAQPLTATPTKTPVPTETPTPTATPTSTRTPNPTPTKTKTPAPTAAAPVPTNTPGGVDVTDPTICCIDLNPDPPASLSVCTFDVDDFEVFDPAFSAGISPSDVDLKYQDHDGNWIATSLNLLTGGFVSGPGSDFSAHYDGTVTLHNVINGEFVDLKGRVTDLAGNGPVYYMSLGHYVMATDCP